MSVLCKVKALFDFDAENDDDLAFKKGDIIKILTKDGDGWLKDSGWWEGDLNSKTGIFPKEFVEEIDENEKEPAAKVSEPEPTKEPVKEPTKEPIKKANPPPDPEPVVPEETTSPTSPADASPEDDVTPVVEEPHAHIPNHMKFGKAMPGLAPSGSGVDPMAELKSKLKKKDDAAPASQPVTAAPPTKAPAPTPAPNAGAGVGDAPKAVPKKPPPSIAAAAQSAAKLDPKSGDEKPEANPFGAFGLAKKAGDKPAPAPGKAKPEEKKDDEDPSASPFKQFGVKGRPVSSASPTPDQKPESKTTNSPSAVTGAGAKPGQEKEGPKRPVGEKGAAPPRPTTQKPIKNSDIPKELKGEDKPAEPVVSNFEKKFQLELRHYLMHLPHLLKWINLKNPPIKKWKLKKLYHPLPIKKNQPNLQKHLNPQLLKRLIGMM